MAAFIAGDEPVSFFDYNAPEAADVEGATTVVAVDGQTLETDLQGEALVGSWAGLTLPAVGSHPVYAVTTLDGRKQRTLLDTLIVVSPYDDWFNVVTARFEWDGAPEDDGTLYRLLNLAQEQVESYAPPFFGSGVPERFRSAQLVQARNTFNASISNGDGSMDLGGGIVINIRPLDWAVKQMIRPPKALKAVG